VELQLARRVALLPCSQRQHGATRRRRTARHGATRHDAPSSPHHISSLWRDARAPSSHVPLPLRGTTGGALSAEGCSASSPAGSPSRRQEAVGRWWVRRVGWP
jgi:hypothetical protein